jgi:mRNA interferase MazF
MALTFHPPTGTIVICNYGTGFVPPEMVKARPVVIVSPRFRRRADLCTVVPLSSTAPEPVEPYHHPLSAGTYPPAAGRPMWAKCDMLATVSLARLDRVKVGKRIYTTFLMPAADMEGIRQAIRHALGLDALTGGP